MLMMLNLVPFWSVPVSYTVSYTGGLSPFLIYDTISNERLINHLRH
jgi:hypothetical protein